MHGLIKLSEDGASSFCTTIEVADIKLAEDNSQWIQAMPLGKYTHPVFGEIDASSPTIQRFTDNVNRRVRGVDLSINYEHDTDPARGKEAAGWIREARSVLNGPTKEQGLWLLVEWVNEAAEAIRDKKFRYFSPEFVKSWTHPSTQIKFNDVLFGGALTNRPFLKGILPITLTENNEASGGTNSMNRKALEALAKKNGIKFDDSTSDADLQTKVEEMVLVDNFNADTKESDDGSSTEDTENEEKKDAESKEGETETTDDKELAKLSESNPVVAGLIAKLSEQEKSIKVLEAGSRVAEVTMKLSELDSEGTTLSPVARQQLNDLMVGCSDPATADKIFKFAETILKDGVVELGERGGKSTLDLGGKTATESFTEEITKLTEGEKGIPYTEAAMQVAKNKPELWDAYNNEMLEV